MPGILVWRNLNLSLLFFAVWEVNCSLEADQTLNCRKCSRPGHQAKMYSNIFYFNCEELEHMTDCCPEEVQCCVCRVADQTAADCSFSRNRRSSLLRSDTSDMPAVQQPSQLSTTSTQSSKQSNESYDVISPEECSQSSDQLMQPSQPASKSSESSNSLQHATDSNSLLPSQQSSLSTKLSQQFYESSGVDSQALSFSQ